MNIEQRISNLQTEILSLSYTKTGTWGVWYETYQQRLTAWRIQEGNRVTGTPLPKAQRQEILELWGKQDPTILHIHRLLTEATLLGVRVTGWPPFELDEP